MQKSTGCFEVTFYFDVLYCIILNDDFLLRKNTRIEWLTAMLKATQAQAVASLSNDIKEFYTKHEHRKSFRKVN